jgi:multidrug resistance efflux pump
MLRATLVMIALVLIVAILSLGYFWPFGKEGNGPRYFGIVEIQEVRLGSKLGGRIEEVLVKEGAEVAANQVLVRFETPELDAQKAQLEARLQAAEAARDRAQAGPRGEEIEAAEFALAAAEARYQRMKAGWRKEEREQAQNELQAANTDLQLTREVFNRIDRLYRMGPKGAATQEEFDAALASRNRAQARKDAAQARVEMLNAGNRPEDIAEAKAEAERARAQLKLLKAGTRKEDKAEAQALVAEIQAKLLELNANLREASIRAPGAAVVDVVAVRKGDVVPPNQPVIRILRAQDLWVRIYVPETELGQVKLGQACRVTVDGYPGEVFSGKVMHIAAISEFTPRNVQSLDERKHQVFGVKIHIDDPRGVFKSGMAAEVAFSGGS